ncbi:MAG: peptidyl-prolyl cis-trans isomerase [Pseudomonadales bacterium]|nr:peptidyl-prolyl cis-trans isomerase [Pseudomonadales bacterium]
MFVSFKPKARLKPLLPSSLVLKPLLLASTITLVNGCGSNIDETSVQSRINTEGVIALIGPYEVTETNLLNEMNKRGVSRETLNIDSFLNSLIDRHAAVIKLKELGLDKDPEFIAKYQKLALNTLKTRFQREANSYLIVSAQEIEDYYYTNQDQFEQPEKSRVSIIEIRNQYGSNINRAKAKLNDVWEAVQKTPKYSIDKEFSRLAAQHSDHRASRYRGGDIGYLINENSPLWPKEFVDRIFELNADSLAKIETDSDRYFIVKIDEYSPRAIRPLQAVENKIKRIIGTRKQQELQALVSSQIREGIDIQVMTQQIQNLAINDDIQDSSSIPAPNLN